MNETQKNELETLRSFVTFRIARVQQNLNAQAAYVLRQKAGISLVEWRLIVLLNTFPGYSITQISEEFGIDKGQASRKIKGMIRDGLVMSRTDPEDHRHQILTLTAKARSLNEALMPVMLNRQKHLVADVSEEEMDVFNSVLERIKTAALDRDL